LGIQLERKVGKVRNWSFILPQGLGQASRLWYRHSGEGRNSKDVPGLWQLPVPAKPLSSRMRGNDDGGVVRAAPLFRRRPGFI